MAHIDTALFNNYPITHLALDKTNLDEAIKHYPKMKDAEPIAIYWIRDVKVHIYNISKMFHNPQALK